MPGYQSDPEDIIAANLMADDEPDGPVGVPLGILEEHLEIFSGIDSAAFQTELERFTAARPFVTTEDALRAVLRGFGVRAKLIAEHLDLVAWNKAGWQLMEIHSGELSRSRPI